MDGVTCLYRYQLFTFTLIKSFAVGTSNMKYYNGCMISISYGRFSSLVLNKMIAFFPFPFCCLQIIVENLRYSFYTVSGLNHGLSPNELKAPLRRRGIIKNLCVSWFEM
jgi:hypothetical protein